MMYALCARAVALLLAAGMFGCSADGGATCGDGTKLHKGVCVVDEDATKPKVGHLELTRLQIAQAGVRPLYLHHPVHIEAWLLVSGEAFATDAVFLLTDAAGTKGCVLGTRPAVYAPATPPPKDGSEPSPELLILAGEFLVPKACKPLVGSKDARVRLAFDSTGAVVLGEDPRAGGSAPTDEAGLVPWLASLAVPPAAKCNARAPDGKVVDCAHKLKVADSPGLDVVIDAFEPGSSVISLAAKPTHNGVDLFTTMTFRVVGTEQLDPDPALHDANIAFRFLLRPEIAAVDLARGATGGDYDWESFEAVDVGIRKCGDGFYIKEAMALFVNVRRAGTTHIAASTLLMSHSLRTMVLDGKWKGFQKFRLRGCVVTQLKETDEPGLGATDNCSETSVIIARVQAPPAMPAQSDPGGQPKSYGVEHDDTYYEYDWAADPEAQANRCMVDKEHRPECAALGDHVFPTPCLVEPAHKRVPLKGMADDPCYCCYGASATKPSVAFASLGALDYAVGSRRNMLVRAEVEREVAVLRTSLFERKPSAMHYGLKVAMDADGWFQQPVARGRFEARVGLADGSPSSWRTTMQVNGFALWDRIVPIDADGGPVEVPALAAKEWFAKSCTTVCAPLACMKLCPAIGAAVAFKVALTIDPAGATVAGSFAPEFFGVADGTGEVSTPLGTFGAQLVFDRYFATAGPAKTNLKLTAPAASKPYAAKLEGAASFETDLDTLDGELGTLDAMTWGGKASRSDVEWHGTMHVWRLFMGKLDADIEL